MPKLKSHWLNRALVSVSVVSLCLGLWSYTESGELAFGNPGSRLSFVTLNGKFRIFLVTHRTFIGDQPLLMPPGAWHHTAIAGFEFVTGTGYVHPPVRELPPGTPGEGLARVRVPTTAIRFQAVAIPFWFTTLLPLVRPVWRFGAGRWRRARTRSRAMRGLCPNCGYTIAGGATRCPECGYGTGTSANPAPGEPQSAAVGRESAGSMADHSAEGM